MQMADEATLMKEARDILLVERYMGQLRVMNFARESLERAIDRVDAEIWAQRSKLAATTIQEVALATELANARTTKESIEKRIESVEVVRDALQRYYMFESC